MSLCLYTYSNFLTPFVDEESEVYPLSLIKVFEPVDLKNWKDIIHLLGQGKMMDIVFISGQEANKFVMIPSFLFSRIV